MKRLTIVFSLLVAAVVLMSWIPRADATSTLFSANCTSCHAATPTTCNGCHAHGVHSSSAKSTINIAGATNKASYAPGETVSVTMTGGYRNGWIRAILY